MKNKIVLSGVNMVEGGILTVYKQMIKSFVNHTEFNVICLVHNKALFNEFSGYSHISFIEFRNIKKSWVKRVYFEYIYSWWLSRKIEPKLWVCLHDISANLYKTPQFVYCHNPSAFYEATYNDWRLDKKFFLFTKFYKFLYKINIRSNLNVIVQQGWIADSFSKWFNIENLLVAKPVPNINFEFNNRVHANKKEVVFIYPAIPRVFKNFEVIIKALKILRNKSPDIYERIKVKFTFSDGVNMYGDELIKKCKNDGIDKIEFIGFRSKSELDAIYKDNVDFLIFPSKLETWGLPLSEAKEYGIPIIAADLPYAYETIGNYNGAVFFDANNADQLSDIITNCITDNQSFSTKISGGAKLRHNWLELKDWDELTNYLIDSVKFK